MVNGNEQKWMIVNNSKWKWTIVNDIKESLREKFTGAREDLSATVICTIYERVWTREIAPPFF